MDKFHFLKTGNKMSKKTTNKKSKVVSFRVPLDDYARYENNCVNLHIEMSSILREAVKKFIKENETKS